MGIYHYYTQEAPWWVYATLLHSREAPWWVYAIRASQDPKREIKDVNVRPGTTRRLPRAALFPFHCWRKSRPC